MTSKIFFIAVFIFVTYSFNSYAVIVPPNRHTKTYFSNTNRGNLSELEFNNTVAYFGNYFTGVARVHNSRLILEKYWSNPLVNLYAEHFDTTWFIHIFGGYARLPNLNVDALLLSLCHELGHHIAGFPYKNVWSTAEGQADYFSTHACVEELWKKDTEVNKNFVNLVDPYSKARCMRSYSDAGKQNLCFRKAVSALNLAQIFAKLQGTPDVNPSFTSFIPVKATIYEHVDAQCRFETFMRGALCPKLYNWRVIPGKVPGSMVPVPTEPKGSNELWAEKESAQSICIQANPAEQMGARPNCWYLDRLSRK